MARTLILIATLAGVSAASAQHASADNFCVSQRDGNDWSAWPARAGDEYFDKGTIALANSMYPSVGDSAKRAAWLMQQQPRRCAGGCDEYFDKETIALANSMYPSVGDSAKRAAWLARQPRRCAPGH
jgi:hypothetical protein